MSATDIPASALKIDYALPPDAPGLVAVLNNREDFERACAEHWYRIPVQSAPNGLRDIRWVAFYLTKVFGREKWSVRHWAKVRKIKQVERVALLPDEKHHPRAQNLYYRLDLDSLQIRPEPIFSRRQRRIVFIPSIWRKFTEALEINDLVHGSPLEDRLWAAFKQDEIEAERQWWVGDSGDNPSFPPPGFDGGGQGGGASLATAIPGISIPTRPLTTMRATTSWSSAAGTCFGSAHDN
jgi:hypothetical protein